MWRWAAILIYVIVCLVLVFVDWTAGRSVGYVLAYDLLLPSASFCAGFLMAGGYLKP